MNNRFYLLIAMALSGFPTAMRAEKAIQDIQPQNLAGTLNAEVGFSFQPVTNVTVTALEYRFLASATNASYVVRLINSGGSNLVSVTLNAATATNQVAYTNISPLLLAAGSTNYLLSYDAQNYATNGTKVWNGSVIDSADSGTGSFAVAPEINYLGASTNGLLYEGTNAYRFLFVGPNFQFTAGTVIQPSSLTILLTPSNSVQLLWPAADTLGQLQSTPQLGVSMADVTNTPVVVGPNNVVELPRVATNAFFRLRY